MKEAAAKIHELGAKYVMIKGGSKLQTEKAVDLLFDGKEFKLYESEKIDTPYIHGAGCTFAAAITAQFAKGNSPLKRLILQKSLLLKRFATAGN